MEGSELERFLDDPESAANAQFKSAVLKSLVESDQGREWLIDAVLAGPEREGEDEALEYFRHALQQKATTYSSIIAAIGNGPGLNLLQDVVDSARSGNLSAYLRAVGEVVDRKDEFRGHVKIERVVMDLLNFTPMTFD